MGEFVVSLGVYGFILLAMFSLWIFALIDACRSDFNGNNKVIWIFLIIFIPFLGVVLYFAIGRAQRLQKLTPSMRVIDQEEAARTEMAFCSNCGTENVNMANFCSNCGNSSQQSLIGHPANKDVTPVNKKLSIVRIIIWSPIILMTLYIFDVFIHKIIRVIRA